MALLVSYDIEDNALRQKIANHIIDSGLERIQYSVYMGTIKETDTQNLIAWLNALPTEKRWKPNDSIIILSLTSLQIQQMVTIGNPQWDKDDLSGDTHTIVL